MAEELVGGGESQCTPCVPGLVDDGLGVQQVDVEDRQRRVALPRPVCVIDEHLQGEAIG
jgi:hypothetical protein